MRPTRRQFLALAAAALGAVAASGCRVAGQATPQGTGSVRASLFAFDTACVIGGVMERSVLDDAVERCRFFERTLSATVEGSDVARINAAAGAPVAVEPETAELVARSLGYSEESGGLFDITIGAVSELWDFHQGLVPDPADIERALPHVGWRNVEVEGDVVRLADARARIDLGGIAKGYIADDLVARLAEAGVESAYVNLGGNVKVLGAKDDGSPWSIGVRDPDRPVGDGGGEAVVATIASTGGSLVTSGLYERRFERDGRQWWHILDPRTGYPVESDLVSVSVYARDSIDGDGLTKPPFMLGPKGALDFLEAHDVQGLLVCEDGSLASTAGSDFVASGA